MAPASAGAAAGHAKGKGFAALPVRLNERLTTLSYLFVRRPAEAGTAAAAAAGPAAAALFVAGLPVVHHPMEAALEAIFSAFGRVLSTAVHQSQLSALVVFESEACVEKVLSTAASGGVVDAPLAELQEPHGLKGWLNAHKAQFPGNAALKKQLDAWMEAFEAREEAAATAADDQGWTVVARKPGGRKTVDSGSAVAVGGVSKAAAEARAQQKPVKQLENFYRHQRQEKKRSELLALRAKFAEDRKKVAEMRASRRFKPY